MSQPIVNTQTFYISSGRKNAMYTLRYMRNGDKFTVDNYVCNLSTDAATAEKKAKDYFDRFYDRVGENQYFKLVFAGCADFDLFERRATLSVEQTEMLEDLERGIMPMGKHAGKRVLDLPASTVLWYADQANQPVEGANDYALRKATFFNAVCAVMLGVALEQGYIAAREERRQEIADQNARSEFVGEIGQRLVFEGKIAVSKHLGVTQVAYNAYVDRFCVIVQCGDNKVVYFGSSELGEVGSDIKFKATVKDHNERDGVKQTIVNRPKVY